MSVFSASSSSDISVDLTDAFRSMILNKRFVLWDDFESALKEFQKVWNYNFIASQTTYTRYIHTESRLLKDVRFRYLFVSFNCTFGHKRKSEGLKVRQKSSKFRNCQSKFRGQHYEVDISICQCNCSMFMMCRYPCRHMLLAYVKRRNLTAHQLLRYCSRWKLHNTQNFQNYTLTALPRRSEEYVSIQRSQRIHKHRIIEKYGERFATEVEKKVDNYYLRILNTNL
ncbi:unnamed protein product [Schistosoma margrebowiei]|uniref:SWIM-type domain-containing protein n=1 Tax=Schistosoma margrebowiei TaxID=48269 RepID=A0AA84ZCC4_9TREM|nr:unnamed protein product [Schistosoma margrebowiei]